MSPKCLNRDIWRHLETLGFEGFGVWELEGLRACWRKGLRALGIKGLRLSGLKVLWNNTWNIGVALATPATPLTTSLLSSYYEEFDWNPIPIKRIFCNFPYSPYCKITLAYPNVCGIYYYLSHLFIRYSKYLCM